MSNTHRFDPEYDSPDERPDPDCDSPEDIFEGEEDYYDDQMDGDAQSALASAGWGTSEDYGDFCGDDF